MEFNEKLQKLRTLKGLTQEELAQALFVSRTAISKWESGRGYPNIDSLKTLANYFGVSIDFLLSGEELLTIAQEENIQNSARSQDLVFGLLDLGSAMLLFLPFFGQKADGAIRSVSLLSFTGISPWLRTVYFAAVWGMILLGIATLALQNCKRLHWQQSKRRISLLLNTLGVLVFIISLQPYPAVLLLLFLAVKVTLLTQKGMTRNVYRL